MYNEDNADNLLYASSSPFAGDTSTDPYVWVLGLIDFDPTNPSNWDLDRDIKKSPLWPYCGKSTGIWKCPADRSTITPSFGPLKGRIVPRVRSMSMNLWVGGFGGYGALSDDTGLTQGGQLWRVFLNANEMIDTGPRRSFVLLDIREGSIDIGNFATDMRGWPDNWAVTGFYDLPGFYHHRACGFSFADGHSEIKRWLDQRTMPPLVPDGQVADGFASPKNK